MAAADSVLGRCQCDVLPESPCGAAITQEDLLCDSCRMARDPGMTHVSFQLPGAATASHGVIDMGDYFPREGS